MLPSIGLIVPYKLTAEQAVEINRRRTDAGSIAALIAEDKWTAGAQAHFGNPVQIGDVFPMIVVAIFPDEFGQGNPGVNGQVFLDGNDSLWITSASEGPDEGQWMRGRLDHR